MDRVKKRVGYWCDGVGMRSEQGRGIRVAILDTGIAAHPDFKGRIVSFEDCVNRRKLLYDDSGHGTHVAGILAGDGRMSKGVLAGMAPKAELCIVKVLDAKGEGRIDDILRGLCWTGENAGRLGIRVVNISAGAKEGFDERKEKKEGPEVRPWLRFDHAVSIFDQECSGCPAQYASSQETPSKKWDAVKTALTALDTSKLHYVKVPEDHIVIDFDIPDETGNKSFERNVEAASK